MLLHLNSRLCFRNWSFASGIEASLSGSELRFRLATTIQIWNFVSKLLLRLKFEASFLESKFRFRKRSFKFELKQKFQIKVRIWIILLIWKRRSDSKKEFRKQSLNSGNKAWNLSCNNRLEKKLWIWIGRNYDSLNKASILEKKAPTPEKKLRFWKGRIYVVRCAIW